MTARKYTLETLAPAVEASVSIAGVLRYLGVKQAGGTQAHVGRRIKDLGLDTSHFTGKVHNRGKAASNRKTSEEVLVLLPEGSYRQKPQQLKRAMVESGVEEVCSECGMGTTWNGKKLVLQVDHVDGNWYNNLLDNVRFLCPNCHSQTETFCKPT